MTMNKVLISNPFLFAPSGDNEEEKQLFATRKEIVKNFVLYSFKEFDKAWNKASEESTDDTQRDLFPMSSPSTSSSAMGDMDMDIFEDFGNFDLYDDFSPSFGGGDLEKELNGGKSNPLNECDPNELLPLTDKALKGIEPETMFPATGHSAQFNKQTQDSDTGEKGSETGSQLMMGESWLSDQNFNILTLTEEDPSMTDTQTTTSTVDTSELQQMTSYPQMHIPEHHAPTPIKNEPEDESIPVKIVTVPARPSRQRRKSVQTNRNVQDSTLLFMEEQNSMNLNVVAYPMKIEIQSSQPQPLANLNGAESRSRHTSTSSSVAPLTPLPSSSRSRSNRASEERKKKRKYEFEDMNDPSVKNAIAAKLNRDKKKKLLQELQVQVRSLQPENQKLKVDIEKITAEKAAAEQEWRQKCESLQLALAEERRKNSANSMQKVKMLDYMQSFIQGIQPTPSVFMSTQLANLPMPNPSELPEIRRTILENPHSIPNDTCLTVKVGIGGQPSIQFDTDENRFRNC